MSSNISPSVSATANNAFGLQLFKEITRVNPAANTFISPLSISVALAMTQLGGRGKTAAEMSATLHWSDGGEQDIHRDYQAYLPLLEQASEFYQLSLANKVFVEQSLSILPDFVETLKTFYHAGECCVGIISNDIFELFIRDLRNLRSDENKHTILII